MRVAGCAIRRLGNRRHSNFGSLRHTGGCHNRVPKYGN
jgi:hypothetical protein